MVWFTQITRPDDPQDAEFYKNSATKLFLYTNNDQTFFICGLKGIGKTLLLRHKSAALRNSLNGVKFVPENELAESLTPTLRSMSSDQVGRLSNFTAWQTIWRTVLTVVVAKAAGVEIPAKIANLFEGLDGNISVQSHLLCIISDGNFTSIESKLHQLSGQINSLLGEVKSGVCLFIDCVDDMVLLHSGDPLKLYREGNYTQLGNLSVDVWSSAQIGFAKAAIEIYNNHKHIKIYGAFRYEALEKYPMADRQNIEPHLFHIQYTQHDLENIIRAKLRVLFNKDRSVFVRSDTDDVVLNFFGILDIEHPIVKNPDRSPLKEKILDYLIRHTRGRPRELDNLGRALQAINPEERNRGKSPGSGTHNWLRANLVS